MSEISEQPEHTTTQGSWEANRDQAVEKMALRYHEHQLAEIDLWVRESCRSPIEKMLAPWLAAMDPYLSGTVNLWYGPIQLEEAIKWSAGCGITIFCQVGVAQYTADFVIAVTYMKRTCLIAVECDGHDYHERTKQQAEHDRKRDRAFQSMGLFVFRFTGSEIFRDASACADEVWSFISTKLEDAAPLEIFKREPAR